MFPTSQNLYILIVVLIGTIHYGESIFHTVTDADWEAYKAQFGKSYLNPAAEASARYYYTFNLKLITKHNRLYENNLRTYSLRANQFTDQRLVQWISHFPKTTQAVSNTPLPPVAAAPTVYDPRTDGYVFTVQDQGTVCNSGWAYATAKSIEAFRAMQVGDFTPAPLSAQNLIDCAGQASGCTSQVPKTAFDYLTVFNRPLYLESSYPNRPADAQMGMCLNTGIESIMLTAYSGIADGADDVLRNYVGNQFPVVIEYNPASFDFMHYSQGVFQQPKTKKAASHFMTVIGYGRDAALNLDYWLVQNSFGTTWGESGFIRIIRSTAMPLAKSALLPIEV